MSKVAIILTGCGVYDGAEIHESVLTLLALAHAGADVSCFAPDAPQHHVINHLTGEPVEGASRNQLVEAARITRGEIAPLSKLNVEDFDAVIFPGGFGAAKNTCTLAFEGKGYNADQSVVKLIREVNQAGKVLGFLCIAPALAAAALSDKNVRLTIGNDADTGAALTDKGARMIDCPVDDIIVDDDLRVVSTPAYMLAQNIVEAQQGINKLVTKVLEMAE